MNKVLIVVTSSRKKSQRVYSGADEWVDGWKFSSQENYKLRTKSMAKPVAVKTSDELANLVNSEDAIIWVRGRESTAFSSTEIIDLVSRLRETNEVYLVYHDEFVGDRVASAMGVTSHQFRPYSLSSGANPEGFKAIIKIDRRGDKYLDAQASFEDIFSSFFLDPTDVFELVIHKLTGSLSVIDLDLQIYEAADFKREAWEQLAENYKGGGASEKLRECQSYLYTNAFSLKEIYNRESITLSVNERKVLDGHWLRLTEVFPPEPSAKLPRKIDELYVEVRRIIGGLDLGIEADVRKNFEGGNLFRKWMDRLELAVYSIKEVIVAGRNLAVGI